MGFRFKKDQRILVKGREYVILEGLSNGDFKLQDTVSNACMAYAREHLIQGLFSGAVSFVQDYTPQVRECLQANLSADFNALPEEKKDKAKWKLQYILEILNQKLERRVLKAYEPIIKIAAERIQDEEPPSSSSLYRWHRDYEASGGNIRSLIDGINKGNSGIKVGEDVDKIMNDVIAELFLDKQRLTPIAIYSSVIARIAAINLHRHKKDKLINPSKSTIYRRIEKLDPYEVAKKRFGKRFADAKFGILKFNKPPTRPLERIEIDHTKTDLMVVDEIRGLLIGRPWITAAIDVYSKSLYGFYLGFTPPSYVSVSNCLLHGIKTKEYVAKEYPDLKFPWYTYGFPELIVVDNAKEFHSTHLEDACLQLQIGIQYAPPAIPWFKGSAERFFGTLNTDLLHQQPGTTFSNYLEKGEYNPAKNAVITLPMLKWLFHKWVVEIYHQSEHRGVHDQPAYLWREGIKSYPPALPQSEDELKILLGKILYKPITAEGITIRWISYKSPALAILRRRHGSDKVRVKMDPVDLSIIYVYDEVERIYIPIPAEDQEYTSGLNQWQHEMICKHARKSVGERIDIVSLACAKEEMRIAVRKYIALRKGNRTCVRAARFANLEADSSQTTFEFGTLPSSSVAKKPNLNPETIQVEGVSTAMSGVSETGNLIEQHSEPVCSNAQGNETPVKKKRTRNNKQPVIDVDESKLVTSDEGWESNYDVDSHEEGKANHEAA